jgi:hypothetical protein
MNVVKLVKNDPLKFAIGAGIIALAMGAFSFFNSAKGIFEDEPVKNPIDDSKATLTPQKATALANVLLSAMHTITGTDEEAIFRVLGKISKPDFAAVYNAFGKKYYSRTFGNEGVPVIDNKLDLLEWLNEELEPEEIDKLRELNHVLVEYL